MLRGFIARPFFSRRTWHAPLGRLGHTAYSNRRAEKRADLLMTERQMAFWHPFSIAFEQLIYEAVGATR
jgi:hypothetical protein